MTQLRILLCAEESAGLQTLRHILASEHELVAVLAAPDHSGRTASVWSAAQKHNVQLIPADNVRDDGFAVTVESLGIDLLLNVHSLYVIRGAILEACRLGAFNLHPGPLPQYAGLNVPSWAIFNGETEHAVTLHEMTAEIDAGTITYESRMPVTETDTGFSLMAKCIRAGVPLITQLLTAASLGADRIPRHAQDFSRRRYFGRKAPNVGEIDWNWPARDVVNHVRAADYSPFASPWGTPQSWFDCRPVGILKAERTGLAHESVEPGSVGLSTESGVHVAAADEWVLVRKLVVDNQPQDPSSVLTTGVRLKAAAHTMCSTA